MDLKFLLLVLICFLTLTIPINCKAVSDGINYTQEDISITFTTVPCIDCDIMSTSAYSIGFSEANFTINNQSIEFHQRLTLWCDFDDGQFSISGHIDNSTLIITETYNTSILTNCYCITYISGLITGIPSNISSLALQIDVNISGKTHFITAISYPILDFTNRKSETTPFEFSYTVIFILFFILKRKKLSHSIR